MATVARIETTCIFGDNETKKITIDNIRPENINISNIKTTIINFNNNSGGALATKMKSKNGFNWTGIKKAQVVYTDKTVLF